MFVNLIFAFVCAVIGAIGIEIYGRNKVEPKTFDWDAIFIIFSLILAGCHLDKFLSNL